MYLKHNQGITVEAMEKRLSKVKGLNAGGPDGLPACIFHDFSHIVAEPLASIADAAMRQEVCGNYLINTVPVPKVAYIFSRPNF